MPLLKVQQVASELSISVRQVYNLIDRGELPTVRIGRSVRVPKDRLEQWIEARIEGGTYVV